MEQIINNRKIEITPNKIYKLIILFGIFCFISGCFFGFSITGYIIYEKLCTIIYSHGILIFDDNYYRIIEVYPTITNNYLN